MKKSLLISAILVGAIGFIMLISGLALVDFNFKEISKQKYNFQTTSEEIVVEQDITAINVDLKLGHFDLVYGDNFHIEYTSSNFIDYHFAVENGAVNVTSSLKGIWWFMNIWDTDTVGVQLTIPSSLNNFALTVDTNNSALEIADKDFTSLHLETSNAMITLKNVTCQGAISIEASNAPIVLENVKSNLQIELETSNAYLKLTNVESNAGIDAETSNNKIFAENVTAIGNIELSSSNSSAELKNIVSSSLHVKTSNAQINAKLIDSSIINFQTSNASINAEAVGNKSDYTILLSTSNGRVNESNAIGSTSKKFTCNTSNANINIYFI